jgi:hypothetical protein
MSTSTAPRQTPRPRRAPILRCDYCVWPARWIAPESGAVVCDPYSHQITAPENCHQLVGADRAAWDFS